MAVAAAADVAGRIPSSPRPRRGSARGAYYKAKTRKWLERLGWAWADLEVVRYIVLEDGTRIPQKHDQFGADLLGVSAAEFVFVQVKGGQYCRSGMAEARRKFEEHVFPPGTKRWLVLWPLQSRQPNVIESTQEGVWNELPPR